jgi:Ca2+-binding RTX toxin-like protein
VIGNTGNDSITGIVDATNATNNTFGPGDNLNGGDGTDRLQVSYTGGAAATSGVTLTDIETIRVINANTGNTAQSLDMSLTSGYKNLVLTGTSGFQFANVGSLVTAEMNATNPAAAVAGTNRAFEIAYDASVVSGTSDSQTLTLSGASTTANQTFFVNGIENLAVNFTTTRSGSAIDAATETQVTVQSGNGSRAAGTPTMKNITIAGNKEGVITFADTTITKIDASAMTGTLRLNAAAPANVGAISILGGSGSDIVTVDTAGALDSSDTVDGGAGNDAIVLTNTASIGAQNGIKNFEALVLATENAFDVTNLVANNKIQDVYYTVAAADGAGTITSTNVPEGTKVTVISDVDSIDHGVKDATNAGTKNSLTVALDNNTADVDVDMATLTVAGIETLTIHSSGVTATTTPGAVIIANQADTNTIATLTAAQASSIFVTGDSDLILTAISANAVLTSIDASKYTGRLLMTNTATSSSATTITGGSGADNITGRATADNISGGAGNDSLVGSGGNDTIAGGAGADTLTGGAGNDVLSGGDGNDSITAGAGSDNLDGGAGDDSFVITYANLTLDDTISGGAGSDAIRFADAADTAIDLVTDSSKMTNVLGVERIDLAAAAGQTVTLNDIAVTNAGGALTIRLANAGADADAVNAAGVLSSSNKVTVDVSPTITRTAALTYTVGNGTDVVSLGNEAVVDAFTVSNLIFLSSADTIAAGGGADTMTITDTVNAFSVNTSSATGRLKNVSGVETVNLTTGAIAASLTLDDTFVAGNADTNGRFNFLVTGAADSGAAKTTLVVDASALTGSFGVLSTYTANAGGTGGATLTGGAGNDSLTGGTTDDSIVGGAGNDTLSGLAGSDSISGGAGVDSIYGGGGSDQITGGAGNDLFFLVSGEGTDFITDFTAGDRVVLTGAAVGGTTLNLSSVTAPTSGTYTIASNFVFRLQSGGVDFMTANLSDKVQLGSSASAYTTTAVANTIITAGDFGDFITLTTNAGTVNGGGGNDSITGAANADSLSGGAGDDTIAAGAGADTITGGAGNDTIDVSAAADIDTIVFSAGTADTLAAVSTANGIDTIANFAVANDILNFAAIANVTAGTTSQKSALVTALNGALTAGDNVIHLDDAAPFLVADATALAALTTAFTVVTSGNVLVAYSATVGGAARIALATLTNGDISSAVDLAVLTGVASDNVSAAMITMA